MLASVKTLDEIVEFLNVDSLEYLTLDNLKTAIDAPGAGFCDACLTGNYPAPVPVPVELSVHHPLGAVATGSRRDGTGITGTGRTRPHHSGS